MTTVSEGTDVGGGAAVLACLEDIGFPLGRTNTAEVPPNAPLQLQLKRWDSYSRCFKRLDPHMEWLSQFMQKNNWITPEKLDRWNKLVEDYQKGRDKADPPGSFNEFLSGDGRRQARALYTRYQQLRKDLVDMATRRRSLKATEQLAQQIKMMEMEREMTAIAKSEQQSTDDAFSDAPPRPSNFSRDSGYSSGTSPTLDQAILGSPSILRSGSGTPAREQPSIRFA